MKDLNSWTTKSQAQKSPGATGLLQLHSKQLCEADYAHLFI